jgi:hypothetical protein
LKAIRKDAMITTVMSDKPLDGERALARYYLPIDADTRASP